MLQFLLLVRSYYYSSMGLFVYILAASLIGLIYYGRRILEFAKTHRRHKKYLDKIAGPVAIPILGTVWQFSWDIVELGMQMRDWGKKYTAEGHGVLKLWISFRPLVVVLRPDTAKVILESNTLIKKGPEYDMLLPWLGTGLLMSTGEKWRNRRKMLTPSFHFRVLNDFLEVHDYQSKIFVHQIEKYAARGKEFDIFPYIKRCALDIICETAMGTTVCAQTDHDHPYVQSVQRLSVLAFMNQRMPWMWIKPIWYMTGFGFEFDRNLKTVTDFTKKVIAEKMAETSTVTNEKKAFLDLLIDLSREGKMSYEDIREEVDTFMFEGHDTTSASLGWTIYCLAHYPQYQEKIGEEMDEIFGDSDRECTTEDLKQMKYLERCIKESLRLRPSVPLFSRVTEEDLEIGGVTVPKGCSIVIAPMMIHTSEQVFSDPETYDPDRFTEENVLKQHPYAYIPFSAGPRNCIGQKFALMEEKTMLSWFFRKYTVSARGEFEENFPLPEIILRPSLGFPITIQPREQTVL